MGKDMTMPTERKSWIHDVIYTPWQNNMDKKNKKDFFLSMLIEG